MERRIRAGGGRPPGSSRQATSIFPESARGRETYARRQAKLLSASRIDSLYLLSTITPAPYFRLFTSTFFFSPTSPHPFTVFSCTRASIFKLHPTPNTARVIENESGEVHKFVARHHFSHILGFPFHRSSYSYCRFSLARCGQEIGVFVSKARWRG